MNEVLIERLERTLWELEQLASELQDLGFIAQGDAIFSVVDTIDTELEA